MLGVLTYLLFYCHPNFTLQMIYINNKDNLYVIYYLLYLSSKVFGQF